MNAPSPAVGRDALSRYLPQDRRAALAAGRNLPEQVEGAALFADLSGFTALAEALVAALGPQRGAEELGVLLNRVYASLLDQADRYGGAVIGFSGDGLTAWFDGDDGLRATACALLMQRQMPTAAGLRLPDGTLHGLNLKVAVAAGPARRLLVGDPAIQVLEVLAGHTLERLAAAERFARPGEVLLDAPTAARLAHAVRVAVMRGDGGYAVVGGLSKNAAPRPGPAPPAVSLSVAQVRPWLPAAVYARLLDGQLGSFAEIRPTVALFLRFGELDYDGDPAAGRRLDAYIRWVQGVLARYEAVLIDLTIGDKGSYLYATFGTPVAHGDDATRAIAAALDLVEPPPALAYMGPAQIGLYAGATYTGVYGGTTRGAYGVIGTAVNLASRLMEAAVPGTVLVSAALVRLAARRYHVYPLDPIQVKGWTVPLAVCRLEREPAAGLHLTEPSYSLPLVGRQAEKDRLRAVLAQVGAGRGQVLGIVGEAGLGKSRLVAEAVRMAQEAGLACYGGEAQSYGTSTPYLAWRPIWRALFDLDPAAPVAAQAQALQTALAALAPAQLPRLPLLGPLLDLPLPETELTQGLEADLRKQSLEALLTECLRRRAAQGPLLIVVEDAHWLDPLSHDLLLAVGRAIPMLPVLVVVAYRTPQIERLQEPRVMALPHSAEMHLAELPPAEAGQWARLKLAGQFGATQAIPAALVDRLVAQAQGNPFYIEELVNYLADHAGDLAAAGAAALAAPDSLAHLILARIDRLSSRHQRILQTASIVGRVFPVDWLWGVDPTLDPPDQVRVILADLARLDITPLERPEPELTYLFKHIVTQQVIYESLPYQARVAMHERLAAWLEARFAAAPPLDLLAFHYARSANPAKQGEYERKAGDAAAAVYANASAVEYYEQALERLPAPAQGAVLRALGAVLERMGAWPAAAARYTAAYALAESQADAPALGAASLGLGVVCRNQGDYAEAATWLARAAAAFEQAGDGGSAAQALADQGRVHWLLGDYPQARQVLEDSRARAVRAGDRRSEASAHHNLGLVAYIEGDYAAAQAHLEAALVLRRALGDRLGISAILNNQAILASAQGDYPLAQAWYEECLALKHELGDRVGIATVLNNLGSVAYFRGEYATAESSYAASLAIHQELGGRRFIANTLNSLGQVATAQGDYDRARAWQEESLALQRDLGNRRGIALALGDLGALAVAQGAYAAARPLLEEGLALYREGSDRVGMVLTLADLARVNAAEGATSEAATRLAEALTGCAQLGGGWTTIKVLAATAQVLPPGEGAARLLGAVAGLLAARGLALTPDDQQGVMRARAAAQVALGAATYQAAWAAGQQLSWNAAIVEAQHALALLNDAAGDAHIIAGTGAVPVYPEGIS
jgi:predicted ATPase/class 3 adenylate cyclase